jgi:hypothetical protein
MVVAHIHTPKKKQETSQSASSNIKVIIQIFVGASTLIFFISEGLSFQNTPRHWGSLPQICFVGKKTCQSTNH